MPTIRQHAESASLTIHFHHLAMAIYEMGDGYSGKNVDRTWLENLYAHTNILLYEMGRSGGIPPIQRHRGKELCLEKYYMQVWYSA